MSKHRTRRTKWNRLLSGVLCLALVLGLLPVSGLIQYAEAESWADPYGEQLVEWGIMSPSSDLRLDSTITRAEFAAMCNRAFGYDKLGSMPFVDVNVRDWYYEDINIAYNAGYFNGTSSGSNRTASPNGTLTRDQAVVMVARNLMLQETVGEVLNFPDSHTFSDWSRGLIGAAVAEGMITGLPDGRFAPANNITRGEVAAMLVRVIGTPINKEGTYDDLGNVYGNLTISSSNVTLRNAVVTGNLYVTGGVDLGNVLLENVTVMGRIVVSGGGESNASQSSVILRNVSADELVVDSMIDQFVTLSAYGLTDIPVTNVRSDAYLEDSCEGAYGLRRINLAGKSGTLLQLAGNIKEVVNKTPFSDLQLVKGTAQKITVDEYARGSQLRIDGGTWVDELNLDTATRVTGKGDIKNLNIGAAGCEVDILPENVKIRSGITATIGGQVIGSVEADELSSEPRFLAGYPDVTNISPTQAEGLFAVNKAGTVYWAVSELARGSVSDEDLINNPAYGGNIFEKQAGTINANSKVDYGRLITKLVPDGSYYLSAILVDGRGNRSPSKTIAFTTPDNTVPAFVKGYPYMSMVTCDTAQVTAMANKSCQLFYALLPAGASAPTPQEFKSGSVAGNLGYSTVNMVKSVPVSITVNRNKLQEKTDYVLYLWLTDYNGAQSSAVISLPFTTPDETPPVVSNVMQVEYADKTAGVSFTINEAPATFFWAVVAEGNETFISPDADLTDLLTKIKVESGSGAIAKGKVAYKNANESVPFTISGLDFSKYKTHNFVMYYIAKDASGNYSDMVRAIPIRTLDPDAPTVDLDYTNAVDGKFLADREIRLIFSEQVKGSSSDAALTFLEYYEAVKAAEASNGNVAAAKADLARELSEHIELWYVPKNAIGTSSSVQLDSDHNTAEAYGWIDFSEATLELKANGTLILTLPANKAVQLGSGMNYFFRFKNIYDDAYQPNRLQDKNDPDTIKEEFDLPFSTVYAQVVLEKNPNEGPTIKADTGGGAAETVRLDMCINVIPQSTSNMADTEYWDLIMWCDTWVEFEIYRKINAEGTENDKDWELVATVRYSTSSEGISWNDVRDDLDIAQKPEKVKDGLVQGTTYTYGIHFTVVNNVKEKNGRGGDPEVWGDTISMDFSVVAGDSTNISNLSAAMKSAVTATPHYDDYVNVKKTVSEIGLVNTGAGKTQNILENYEKVFTDTQVPSFRSGYPRFEDSNITSTTFIMDVMLDRPGKLYYVVAPETSAGTPSIPITTGDGVSIDSSNDRDNTSKNAATDKTYIPLDGKDRDDNKPYIYFVTGKNAEKNNQPVYIDPAAEYISASRKFFPPAKYPTYKMPETDKGVDIGVGMEQIQITGLQPQTKYYVYVVLQGGGLASEVVEVYQVETKEAQPPIIKMNSNYVDATMTPNDYVVMHYMLVVSTDLLKDLNDTRDWPGQSQKRSLLWAMMTRTEGPESETYFDKYASPDERDTVMQYVTGSGSYGNEPGVRNRWSDVTYDPAKQASGVYQNFTNWLPNEKDMEGGISNDNTCVLLVVARNYYATTDAKNYGFAAASNLYVPNLDPPTIKGSYIDVTRLEAYWDEACTTPFKLSNRDWAALSDAERNGLYYKGSIIVEFSGPIYQFYRDASNTRLQRPIWTAATATDGGINVMEVISTSIPTAIPDDKTASTYTGPLLKLTSKSVDVAQSTFQFSFTGIQNTDYITFLNEGNIGGANPASNTLSYSIQLRFYPNMTTWDKGIAKSEEAGVLEGGFQIVKR